MKNGKPINENHYFFAPFGKLKLHKASILCSVEQISENQARLTLTSDTFVWLLHLKELSGAQFSDNDFVLLPGESRTVTVTGEDVCRIPEYVHLNPGM